MAPLSPRPPLLSSATPDEMAADLARIRSENRRAMAWRWGGLLAGLILGLLAVACFGSAA